MIRLLKFLITGDWHLHEWVLVREERRNDDTLTKKLTNWPYAVMRCKHCGKMRSYKL